jgi:predicted glycosyltransferase
LRKTGAAVKAEKAANRNKTKKLTVHKIGHMTGGCSTGSYLVTTVICAVAVVVTAKAVLKIDSNFVQHAQVQMLTACHATDRFANQILPFEQSFMEGAN